MSASPAPSPDNPRVTACDPVPGYSPGIGRYVAQLAETRSELLCQVEGLSADELGWHPNDETESIGTQLLHVAAIEWSWVFEEIFRRPSDEYDGWEEALPIRVGRPQVAGQPLAYYTERIERIRSEALAALKGLTDADLGRLVPTASPAPDEEPGSELYSVDWILFHLVHHEAHHAGQVELLRRLVLSTQYSVLRRARRIPRQARNDEGRWRPSRQVRPNVSRPNADGQALSTEH